MELECGMVHKECRTKHDIIPSLEDEEGVEDAIERIILDKNEGN